MNPVLNQNLFFVKEHIGFFKAANNYDIYEPASQELIMTCREEKLGFFTKLFRFSDYKRNTPFHIEIKTSAGEPVLSIKRGVSFFLSTVHVFNEKEELIGKFKQQLFSVGGRFKVVDKNDNFLCTLKGKWTSWDFKFMHENTEYAHVSKKWTGLGQELFSSADNYMLQISDHVPKDDSIRILILAAVMCIDMVLKE